MTTIRSIWHGTTSDHSREGRRTIRNPTRATILDVARRAGVDRAVVSKVLSGDESLRVRDATRERVRLAAAELEYQPNFLARGLARAKAGAVGLLVPAGCWSRALDLPLAEVSASDGVG